MHKYNEKRWIEMNAASETPKSWKFLDQRKYELELLHVLMYNAR